MVLQSKKLDCLVHRDYDLYVFRIQNPSDVMSQANILPRYISRQGFIHNMEVNNGSRCE